MRTTGPIQAFKARKSGRDRDWKRYKKLKKSCQEECSSAYNSYIADMIAPDMDSNSKKFWSCQEECSSAYNSYIADMIAPDMDSNSKKFWSFVKSKRTDKCGIAPLKDDDGLTYSEPALAAKAEILNK